MFHHAPSRFSCLLLMGVLALVGCGTSEEAPTLAGANTYGQQTSTASSLPALIVDASTQAILDQGTGQANDLTVRSLGTGVPRVPKDGSLTIQVSTLTHPGGAPMFPNASGSLSISWTGTTISSWPSSLAQSLNATVTVSATSLTVTDPSNGNSATVTGTLTFDLDGTVTGTDRFNWTTDFLTDATVSSSSPLQIQATRSSTTETITVTGRRKAQHQSTSTETSGALTPATRTGTRTFTRTISGTVSSPAGGGDALLYTELVASKSAGKLGTVSVLWNRAARFKGSYNYSTKVLSITAPTTTPTGSTGDQVYDRTFLTLKQNSTTVTTVGPKTAAEMATYLQSTWSSFSL